MRIETTSLKNEILNRIEESRAVRFIVYARNL